MISVKTAFSPVVEFLRDSTVNPQSPAKAMIGTTLGLAGSVILARSGHDVLGCLIYAYASACGGNFLTSGIRNSAAEVRNFQSMSSKSGSNGQMMSTFARDLGLK